MRSELHGRSSLQALVWKLKPIVAHVLPLPRQCCRQSLNDAEYGPERTTDALCVHTPTEYRGVNSDLRAAVLQLSEVHSNDWRLLFAKVHPCLAWTCWLEHSPRPWMRHSARASATVALSPFAPLTGLPAGHAIGQHFVPSHGRAARKRSGLDTKGQQAMTPRWFGWMGEQVSALYGARQSLRPSIY